MQWLIIGISGITCGGKTTLAQNLHEYFQNGQQLLDTQYKIGVVHMISQDDYFLPVNDKRHQIVKRINAINYELLTSLDMEKMLTDLAWIMRDTTTNTTTTTTITNMKQQQQQQLNKNKQQQKYLANKQKQKSHHQQQQQQQQRHDKDMQKSLLLQQIQRKMLAKNLENRLFTMRNCAQNFDASKVNILIIEGFTIFNHCAILNLCNIKFHFHLPYEKCYERRLKRTYDPPDVVGYFELCVWPHYEQSLNEYKHCKDIIYMNGELAPERLFKFALKKCADYFGEKFNAIDNSYWDVLKSDTKKSRSVNMRYNNNNNNNNNNKDLNNFDAQHQHQQQLQAQPAHFTIFDKMQH